MKAQQFFLAVAAVSSTITAVAAHGPFLLWSNKFSKTAMEDWIGSIRSDKTLAQDYNTVIKSGKHPRCPTLDDSKGLKDKSVDISLAFASGSWDEHWVDRGSWSWRERHFTSMSKPNDITFIYNINGGTCGHIKVTTSKQIGMVYLEYKWSAPVYEPPYKYNFANIDLKSVKVDASSALKKAGKKYEVVKSGVRYVTLKQNPSTETPQYIFGEPKGGWPREVTVDASSGKVTERGF